MVREASRDVGPPESQCFAQKLANISREATRMSL